MPASEARIAANRASALKSTGPRTPEGKGVSEERPEARPDRRGGRRGRGGRRRGRPDGRGVPRRTGRPGRGRAPPDPATGDPGGPDGAVGPPGVRGGRRERPPGRGRLRGPRGGRRRGRGRPAPASAGRRALFDPSREATLARKYEAAAERGFFRTLKEIREIKAEAKALDRPAADQPGTDARAAAEAARARASLASLGSFFSEVETAQHTPPPARSAPPAKSPAQARAGHQRRSTCRSRSAGPADPCPGTRKVPARPDRSLARRRDGRFAGTLRPAPSWI